MDHVKPEDVEALVRMFDNGDWDEMRIGWRDFELYLSRDPSAPGLSARPAGAAPAAAASAGTAAPASVPTAARRKIADGLLAIRAPNLGTFYRAPKPGAPSFVEVGQQIEEGTEVCIIEVMKLFTAVRAGASGTVREILVEDGEMVEFDQPLFLIEPFA